MDEDLLLRGLLERRYRSRGWWSCGKHGAVQSPLDYLDSAMMRQTERIRTSGAASDIDQITEFRGRSTAIEFKREGQTLGFGQFGILRWLAQPHCMTQASCPYRAPGAISLVGWLNSAGEVIAYAQITPEAQSPPTAINIDTDTFFAIPPAWENA
ncbi:MAG: hypothetical protein M0R66_02950 [Candidatus Omnitrophica bacterium]|nr:hypothetical protein [Candidatus Omnitrophota bacterium]